MKYVALVVLFSGAIGAIRDSRTGESTTVRKELEVDADGSIARHETCVEDHCGGLDVAKPEELPNGCAFNAGMRHRHITATVVQSADIAGFQRLPRFRHCTGILQVGAEIEVNGGLSRPVAELQSTIGEVDGFPSILQLTDGFFELSNYYIFVNDEAPVNINGRLYYSTENAFQATKFADHERGPFEGVYQDNSQVWQPDCDDGVQMKDNPLKMKFTSWSIKTFKGKNGKDLKDPSVFFPDVWNGLKAPLAMKAVIAAKFAGNPGLQQKLLETGDRKILVGNSNDDTTWGSRFIVDKGTNFVYVAGNDINGDILMRIRESLLTGGDVLTDMEKQELWEVYGEKVHLVNWDLIEDMPLYGMV